VRLFVIDITDIKSLNQSRGTDLIVCADYTRSND
jgi:hypothetical protein